MFTYDQRQRYRILKTAANQLVAGFARGAAGRIRVLDVGGAAADPAGGGYWLPLREIFIGAKAENPGAISNETPFLVSLDVVGCRERGFVRGSGLRLPFKDGTFDVVAALDVLEHVPAHERGRLTAEMARVSADMIVISCPVKETIVEKAEGVIAGEIARRLGVRQAQLDEHREYGLPGATEVDNILGGLRPFVSSFGYGSVPSWLVYQAFRSDFLGRRDSPRIVAAIDRYWMGQNQFSEYEPPGYRRFWIASIKKWGTQRWGTHSLSVLKDEQICNMSPYLRDFVSAIVLTSGPGESLSKCLTSLLHQKVDFDLEVAVWIVSGPDNAPTTAEWLRERFPAVRFLSPSNLRPSKIRPGRAPSEEFFAEAVYSLRGDYCLLIDEDFELPLEAVAFFLAEAKRRPKNAVLAGSRPRVPALEWAWAGGRFSPLKRFAGRRHRPRSLRVAAERGPDNMPFLVSTASRGWIYGDALFFRRVSLLARRPLRSPRSPGSPPSAPIIDKRRLLLWER